MDLKAALDWLYSTQLFGIKLGLSGVERLLAELRIYPSRQVRVVHVAGTNGKGSTSAMIEAIARVQGFTTGLFTSPHLVNFRERIRINGQMVEASLLLESLQELQQLVENWEPHPTFFELTLAAALRCFQRTGVNFIVLETGLGGRLDATNAVPKDIAVLTPISLDHQQYLGNTLDLIAAEKAGIIAAGKPVVSAQQPSICMQVIERRAAEQNAPLSVVVHTDQVPPLSLPGSFQQRNAALAILVMQTIGLLPEPALLESALASVSWPGRFQELHQARIILDGAHNPHGAKALVETWRERFGDEQASIIFAASADKDICGILKFLSPIVKIWHLPPCSSPRIQEVSVTQSMIQEISNEPVILHHSLDEAFRSAQDDNLRILIAGSLFLLGDALALFQSSGPRRATMQ